MTSAICPHCDQRLWKGERASRCTEHPDCCVHQAEYATNPDPDITSRYVRQCIIHIGAANPPGWEGLSRQLEKPCAPGSRAHDLISTSRLLASIARDLRQDSKAMAQRARERWAAMQAKN